MIEFFEFLNGCSPQRTFAYLVFILILAFIAFSGLAEVIRRIVGGGKNYNHYYFNDSDMTDEEIEDSVKNDE